TGKNIPFYPADGLFVGVDVSSRMLARAVRRAEEHGRVVLLHGSVERLPFRSSSFDACVSTYVFCSVDEPLAGLRELRRVLRRGGRAYFLEHMRSESRVVGAVLDLLNPVARMLGPEINRRTRDNIVKAGFSIVEERMLLGTVFRFIVAEK
ncbi:MAG: class I SAM-dependent methyltransferase, partial [Euryarchaeota archaeon]|nr:class I SAM-dependent methyltransferase [Euryarchaeota archaeon]